MHIMSDAWNYMSKIVYCWLKELVFKTNKNNCKCKVQNINAVYYFPIRL